MNSGIQRGLDFTKPESIDLSLIELEFRTNYLSYIALAKGFLPFLLRKKEESSLVLWVFLVLISSLLDDVILRTSADANLIRQHLLRLGSGSVAEMRQLLRQQSRLAPLDYVSAPAIEGHPDQGR